MEDKDTLIKIDSMSLKFPGNNGYPLSVFKNLSLDIKRGEFIAIVGPSGCGKTSLLKLVGDLIQPTEGTILINEHTPREARKNRKFSFVFQNPVLLPWRTVLKNVEIAGEIFHDSKVRSRAQEFINLVGLNGFENAYPNQLSGGMESRVAIARALTFNPEVLLMDEPFADLDELTRFRMNMELLRVWHSQKPTVLFVTHSLREAIFLADNVVVLAPRPSKIKGIFQISLPRPRKIDITETPQFARYVSNLRDKLQVEF